MKKSSLARVFGAAMVFLAALSASGPALAAWPDRPVRVIVPFAAGGGTDIYVRYIAEVLSKRLGQPFYVQNVAGANGAVAVRQVKIANPDGYTLLGTSNSPIVVNPALQPKSAIDPLTELAPVGMFVESPLVLAAAPSTGIKSLKELLAQAKAKPGQLTYSSAGIGNASHLATELLALMAGVKFTHIPYNSAGQASLAVLSNQVQFTLYGPQSVAEYIKRGQLVALAIAEPVDILPGVPTFADLGYGEVDAAPWGGLFFPPGTPKEFIEKLDAELALAMRDDQVLEGMKKIGVVPKPMRTAEFRRHIEKDLAKWRRVISEAGITTQ
jgi:tripartite-type tricarboxylate transporter receptor subunit TctC